MGKHKGLLRRYWSLVAVLGAACAVQEPRQAAHLAGSSAEAAVGVRPVLADAVNRNPPLTVRILEARRTGSGIIRLEMELADGRPQGPAPEAELRKALSDMCLMTAAGHHRLFVLRRPDGQPLWGGANAVSLSRKRLIWAKFPAPPSGTTVVTLLVPGLQPVRNIPLS
jgi:hypothetical protein